MSAWDRSRPWPWWSICGASDSVASLRVGTSGGVLRGPLSRVWSVCGGVLPAGAVARAALYRDPVKPVKVGKTRVQRKVQQLTTELIASSVVPRERGRSRTCIHVAGALTGPACPVGRAPLEHQPVRTDCGAHRRRCLVPPSEQFG